MDLKLIFRQLGPGLLYAGAAVGVSHLVQSTRAGVSYGYDLIWIIVTANILKFPFFEIATRYTALAKQSLLDGYATLGKWSLALVGLITFSTAWIVICAITVVTAGLAVTVTGFGTSSSWSLALILIAATILIVGKYHLLSSSVKWVVLLLTALTIIAVVWAGSQLSIQIPTGNFSFEQQTDVLFLIALVGWMPAPFDITLWTSFWVKERYQNEPNFSAPAALRDFHIGYWGTTGLAILFVLLGAFIGFSSTTVLPETATGFAAHFIQLYTSTLGGWTFWLIAPAAFAAMISTLLTVIDGFARVSAGLLSKWEAPTWSSGINVWIIILCLASILFIVSGLPAMRKLIDWITSVSFLTAPILGVLNLLVLYQSGLWWKKKITPWIAGVGLLSLTIFSGYYIYVLWIN